jgi:hypothetical protein
MQTDIMNASVRIADHQVVVRRRLRAPFASEAAITVGLSNPEIGARLRISRWRAATHRANLLSTVGLKGRQDIIRDALKRGLLER